MLQTSGRRNVYLGPHLCFRPQERREGVLRSRVWLVTVLLQNLDLFSVRRFALTKRFMLPNVFFWYLLARAFVCTYPIPSVFPNVKKKNYHTGLIIVQLCTNRNRLVLGNQNGCCLKILLGPCRNDAAGIKTSQGFVLKADVICALCRPRGSSSSFCRLVCVLNLQILTQAIRPFFSYLLVSLVTFSPCWSFQDQLEPCWFRQRQGDLEMEMYIDGAE